MKEEKLILLLRQMKHYEPPSNDLVKLKNNIFSRVNKHAFLKQAGFFFVTALAIFTLLVILSFTNIIPQTRETVTSLRIAIASNKLQKARLALTLSQYQLTEMIKVKNNSGNQIVMLAKSTEETNNYLASLKLMGEKGLYTNLECLNIYRKYDRYLEELKTAVSTKQQGQFDTDTKNKLRDLKMKISGYENETDNRLKLY